MTAETLMLEWAQDDQDVWHLLYRTKRVPVSHETIYAYQFCGGRIDRPVVVMSGRIDPTPDLPERTVEQGMRPWGRFAKRSAKVCSQCKEQSTKSLGQDPRRKRA